MTFVNPGQAYLQNREFMLYYRHFMKLSSRSIAVVFSGFLFFQALVAPVSAASLPMSSSWAREIVPRMDPLHTNYQHGVPVLTWRGVSGAADYISRADCSGFLLALFSQAYGLTGVDYKSWTGSTRPSAAMIHDYIKKNKRFTTMTTVTDIIPGDVIAIKYLDGTVGSTGHIALVDGAPQELVATAPLLPATKQWSVRIIDSTETPHSTGDSRQLTSGSYSGLGTGTMRLYTDLSNRIIGYSWSLSKYSIVYQRSRDIVVGRY